MNSELFKDRLRQIIGKESNSQFAKKCEISEGTVRRYLKGAAFPPLDTLQAIANVSGVSLGWLASGEGEMKRGGTGGGGESAKPQPAQHQQGSPDDDAPLSGGRLHRMSLLLRDVIELYETHRPGREPERKAREIAMIYRHFLDFPERDQSKDAIKLYMDDWY